MTIHDAPDIGDTHRRPRGSMVTAPEATPPEPPVEHSVDHEPPEPTTESAADGSAGGWREVATGADGRRRRRQAAGVIGIALACAAGGMAVGSRLSSPADQAASRAAPAASRITVPVERQVLTSSLVLSGEVQYVEPIPVLLAGPVGIDDGDSGVVTRAPEVGAEIADGDVLLEVSGRPVFAVAGTLPLYRTLSVGAVGPDVLALEVTLERLGFDPGPVDSAFDTATADAVAAMYADAGYTAQGPTAAERDAVLAARQAVTDAEGSLRDAERQLALAGSSASGSQIVQLRQAVTAAEAAVPASDAAASRELEAADQQVASRQGARNAAEEALRAARARHAALTAPGAIDPDTGVAPTSQRVAESDAEVTAAAAELAAADMSVADAARGRDDVAARTAVDQQAARDRLVVARLELDEATAVVDTTAEREAVGGANDALERARNDLATMEREAGIRVTPGEFLFVPAMPTSVTESWVVPGSGTTDQLGTLATSATRLTARVSRTDSGFVAVGASVVIELRDVDITTTGTVVSMGVPATDANDDDGGSNGGGTSGRLEVVIEPDDPAILREWVYVPARITIDVGSTDGEVLVVPVAALVARPDGGSRVEVESEPVSAESVGSTRLVDVEVGLAANGLVEITSGDLEAGDRVVVGTVDDRAVAAADSESGDADGVNDEG